MRKYIIHEDDYMGDTAGWMYSKEAESKIDLIKEFMGIDEYDTEAEWKEDNGLNPNCKYEDIYKEWDNINGDGRPYIMVFDIESNKCIIG